MGKTLEEMTIAELQQVIAERKRLSKKAPKLRAEKAQLEKRLAEIDALLAQAGATRGRRPDSGKAAPAVAPVMKSGTAEKIKARRGRPPKTAVAPAPTASKGMPQFLPGKRLPRGVVQNAVLKALGSSTMSPAAVAKVVNEKFIAGIPTKNIAVTMDKMMRSKKIIKADRGLYKNA